MATKIVMPQLGESIVEGTVTGWHKQVGDEINEFDPLLDVETDKVTSEIPSPASGTVLKILVHEGETVAVGTVLAWVGEPGEEISAADEKVIHHHEPHETPDIESIIDEPVLQRPAGRNEELGYISPVVARLAREKGVDLTKVKGTGMDGRITKKDVQNYLKEHQGVAEAEIPIWETPADGDLFRPTDLIFAKKVEEPVPTSRPEVSAIPGETLALTPMRRRIAEHMVQSVHSAPHVTTVMEADMSQVARHRTNINQEVGKEVNVTYTAYMLSAIVTGLKAVPLANSTWTETGIRIHKQINLGMAVALPDGGLIVPVIKNADELSLIGLAKKINDLAERARRGQLKPDEVQNGTFSLTNHGIQGSLFATPIINQPQSGILGAGLIQKRPVVVNDAIAIKPMMYLSYSFDHRILDGASADTFLAKVVDALENWQ